MRLKAAQAKLAHTLRGTSFVAVAMQASKIDKVVCRTSGTTNPCLTPKD